MATRKTKSLAARLGSLFAPKPEKLAFPHIALVTESEAHHHAKGHHAVKHGLASLTTSATQGNGVGKLHKVPDTQADEGHSAIDEATLANEEGFMQKVKMQKTDKAPRKGIGLWTMFKDRVSGSAPAMRQASTESFDAVPDVIDVKQDSFLQHASAGSAEPVIRTESSFSKEATPAAPAPASALDEVTAEPATLAAAKSRRSSEAKPDEAGKAEIAKAMKENADIVEETAKSVPAPKPEKQPKKKVHIAQFESKKGFKAFLTSINYIGLGKERISFIQNMATMLNAGLPLTDALKTLVLETRAKPMRKMLSRIIDAVENGSPLWRAMEAQNFFSLHALALVRIGEEAGSLAQNMGYLAEQDEKDNALRSKVKMAMIYPTIVMVIMFIIVVGLGMFVLPNLVGVLFSLNVKLPLITRIVIMCSDAFVAYGAVGVPSFIAAFILVMILSKYTRLRVVTQWVMFKIPGIGRLAKEATIARFGVILGGLLKAGVPVVEALESLVQVTPIASYKNLYAQMLAHVTIGDSFAKSFASIKGSHKLLPPSVQQLVITGEKSGSLADIMLKVADIYDKKATGTAEKLPIILEPMLLLFIGGLVGSIAFAIIVPIYSIVGNVGA